MISFREAEDTDMYDVQDIRNQGREYMTHNTNYITTEEQEAWWETKEENGYEIWVVESDNYAIGFCMIREIPSSGRSYGTLAIREGYRGFGIGTEIYRFMTRKVDELWIDVRNDNLASLNAALKAGFEVHYIGPYVTELLYRKII